MRCPKCPSERCRVVDSRSSDDASAIRRRRECLECGVRYTTFERIELEPVMIRKRDGSLAPFDQSKIVAGLRVATKGRPLSDAVLVGLASSIEDSVRCADAEIQTSEIGQLVLDRLGEFDEVAYLRFASVHKSFADPADFEAELVALAGRRSTT